MKTPERQREAIGRSKPGTNQGTDITHNRGTEGQIARPSNQINVINKGRSSKRKREFMDRMAKLLPSFSNQKRKQNSSSGAERPQQTWLQWLRASLEPARVPYVMLLKSITFKYLASECNKAVKPIALCTTATESLPNPELRPLKPHVYDELKKSHASAAQCISYGMTVGPLDT
ncbi:unnamed protein product [Arctogadus glacialis]